MRKLAIVLLLSVTASGCIVRAHGRVNPLASLIVTGVAVAVVASTVEINNPPPPAVDVGYYGYYRPGYVWVNGRHTWNGSAWAWQPGYYQAQRGNQAYVQGYRDTRGNQYVWVDGYWAAPRPGYVYVDGYYDYQSTGYVWHTGTWEAQRPGYVYVQGSWSTGSDGRRSWNRGGWQTQSQARPAAVYTGRANGGVIVTPR